MNINKTLLLLFFTILFAPNCKAQQLQATLSHYNTSNDLVSNAVSHIIQDEYGYLWIATWNGLSRFDGFNFYNYKLGAASGIELLHNRIIDLKTDHYQNIWMRMYDGRIFILNRTTDKITNALEGVTGYENFKTYHPLTVTSKGDVMAAIDKTGIYKMKFDPKTNTIKKKFITTNKIRITSIVEGYKNDLWVGTANGIKRLGPNDESISSDGIFPEEEIICMYSNGFNIYAGTSSGKIISFAYGQEPQIIHNTQNKGISSIFVDSHNQMWFTTSKIGITRLDLNTGITKDYTQDITVPEYDVNGAFVTEVNGVVWINMNHGGFGYYNRDNDVVEYFHNNPKNAWDLSNTVTTYIALKEDVIFESTSRKGLEKLMILKKTINRIKLFNSPDDADRNEVRALFYDKQRKMLMAGNSKGDLFITKDDKKTHITSTSEGLPLGRIYDINKDRMGNYWISTKGEGLLKMTLTDNGNYQIISYKHDENDPYSLSSNNVYCSVEDKHGNIWIATYDGGVNIMKRNKSGGVDFINNNNKIKNYPQNSYHKVRAIAIDKDGNVWAGTTDGLLIIRYDGNEITINKAIDQPVTSKRLQCNDIICIGCSPIGDIWIGTNGGGLSRSTGKDENGFWTFETFGSKEGLPSEEIKSLTFDNRGNVWFTTDHIICSYDIQKKIFSTFSFQDGVDDTYCSERTAISVPEDNILIGTQKGYYFVDRKKLVRHTGKMLKLKITDFFINNSIISPRSDSSYDYYIPDSKKVELKDHDCEFSLRFASLNYQLQHRVHYQYKLEGYDNEWINADKTRIATYSNIPGGTYTFRVKAFLLESPEKIDERTIVIIVPPHFLLSAKALWIYIPIILIIIFIVYTLRKIRIEKRRKVILNDGWQDIKFTDKTDLEFVKQQFEWLENHYANAELKVEDIVLQSSLSRTAYYNKLKTLTGLSPKEFISEFRLKKAIYFLKTDKTSTVSEIAIKTGFSNESEFIHLFKQRTGQTPAKFRDTLQEHNMN